jgi:RNA polymerase sigma-70 factor (ECF subfamily)
LNLFGPERNSPRLRTRATPQWGDDIEPNPNSRWSAHDVRDAELVRRIGEGERLAFEALYRDYFVRLGRFLHRLLGRSPAVDEVINDTMYVVWHRARQFSAGSRVSTWIFGIAYRKALKALARSGEPAEFDAELHGAAAASTDQLILQAEWRRVLERALAQLTPEQRAVIELTYYHGCPYREIAEIVGCPVETVKTRMFYARRRLRDVLNSHRKELPWADESSIC